MMAAWREVAVSQLASNLRANFITPSFHLYASWAIVEGSEPGLYANTRILERFRRSAAASVSLEHLTAAYNELAAVGKVAQNHESLSVAEDLLEQAVYMHTHSEMSELALLHLSEFVGRTLQDYPDRLRRWERIPDDDLFVVTNYNIGASHVFEVVYALTCLHAYGAAHGDIDARGITLVRWANTFDSAGKPRYTNPVQLYVAGVRGEADAYVFPATGIVTSVIDFSRAILGPGFEFRDATNPAAFYRDQEPRALRTLHQYSPALVEAHEAVLRTAVRYAFPAFFRLVCVGDFAAAMTAYVGVLERTATEPPETADLAVRTFIVEPRLIELTRAIAARATAALADGIAELVTGTAAWLKQYPEAAEIFPLVVSADGEDANEWAPKTGGGIDLPEAPPLGPLLIEEFFGEWQFNAWADAHPDELASASLVDFHVFRPPGSTFYRGENYDDWPPWAKFDAFSGLLSEAHAFADLGAEDNGDPALYRDLRRGAPKSLAEAAAADAARVAQLTGGPRVSPAARWL
jgi:hypothetical protein